MNGFFTRWVWCIYLVSSCARFLFCSSIGLSIHSKCLIDTLSTYGLVRWFHCWINCINKIFLTWSWIFTFGSSKNRRLTSHVIHIFIKWSLSSFLSIHSCWHNPISCLSSLIRRKLILNSYVLFTFQSAPNK